METLVCLTFKFLFSRATPPDLRQWTDMAESYDNLTESVSTIYAAYNVFSKFIIIFCACESEHFEIYRLGLPWWENMLV